MEGGEFLYIFRSLFIVVEDRLYGYLMLLYKRVEGWVVKGFYTGIGKIGFRFSLYFGWL